MARPFLSVVIPAFNEGGRIEATVRLIAAHLSTKRYEWEIVVADDGSEDGTAAIVRELTRTQPRVRLVQVAHGGKGWAVRHGMLAAQGKWRFMCDADLAMPPEQIDRFFVGEDGLPPYDVCVGSREAPGARRFGEPWRRHMAGRAFNWVVRMVAVRGLDDTQCGFKLFRGDVVSMLFERQRLRGFAFDVEALHLSRKAGLSIGEIAIDWRYPGDSSVSLRRGASAFVDILRIRLNDLLGRYRLPAGAAAAAAAPAHPAATDSDEA